MKFDMHVLARLGIHIQTPYIFDTMIASWICDENAPKGLKQNTENILNIDQTHIGDVLETVTKEQKKQVGLKASNKATFDLVTIENATPYAVDDSYFTFKLYLYYLQKLEDEEMDKIYYRVYPQFIYTLFNMEERGMTVDIDKLKNMQVEMQKDMDSLLYEMYEIAGVSFNPSSSAQLAQLLFGYDEAKNTNKDLIAMSFGFPVISVTSKGVPQANTNNLKLLSKKEYKTKRKQQGIELVKKLLEYKKLSKLKTAFVDGMLEQIYDDGRVHPSFNPVGTDSGRISCIAENTPITVVNGYKNIQDMKEGDLVYCYDDMGNPRISKVTRFIDNGIRPCIKIKFKSTGKHDLVELVCTPDHKIRLRNGEWVEAKDLVAKDKVTHLRRSQDDRPRVYGTNNYCNQEQLLIKQEVFKCCKREMVIHHKDGNKSNNSIDNLELMPLKEHTRLHSNRLVKEGRIKFDHLYTKKYDRNLPTGKDHPKYKEYTKDELEALVHKYKGIIKNIPMDFNTFKLKCKEVNFDYKEVASIYQKQYNNPTREEFTKVFFECEGVAYKIKDKLNIGRTKCEKLIKEYDLCYNHEVVSIEIVGDKHVYDLEVDKYHNFIASEVCVHNCNSPNLMQLPNAKDEDKYQIRDCFIGGIDEKTGKRKFIISVDYSNLEVRVMAHFSQDPNLLKAFAEGKDLHGNTAKLMFMLDCDANEVKQLYPDLRQQGKVIAFLLQYGGSSYTLYEDLNKEGKLDSMAKQIKLLKEQGQQLPSDLKPFVTCSNGKDIAQKLMDMYFDAFKGIAKFMKHQKKYAHRHEFVYTLTKRKRRLPDINSNDYKTSAYLERLSINACIQGSGADIMINAQNKIEGTSPCYVTSDYIKEMKEKNGKDIKPFIASDRLKELDCQMLVQIHDELLFECPEENCEEAMQIIRDCMIHPFGEKVKLNVNLEVGMGAGKSYQTGH